MNNLNDLEKTVAVIDVGTLKSKFEIRCFNNDGSFKTLFKDKKLTVLGRDLPKNNYFILDSAVQTTIEALQEFVNKMNTYNVQRYEAVTTEAVRKAKNANDVLDRIKKKTGIDLKILSKSHEAEVFFNYVAKDFPNKQIAVVDVGGGSVQVVIGTNNKISDSHSFKTGSYFMQEEFSDSHHPTAKELNNAIQYVANEFKILRDKNHFVEELVYGSTNIIDFFKAMKIPLYNSGYHGEHIFRSDISLIKQVYEKIITLCYEDRMPMFPAEPYYMWSAENALINVFELIDIFGLKTVIPSNANISSGLLYNLVN